MFRIKILLFCLCFLCLMLRNTNAQSFNYVGCKALKNRETFTLGVYHSNLIHSGNDSICGLYIGGLSLWNGIAWSKLKENISPNDTLIWGPRALLENNDNLFIGGSGGGYYIGNKVVNGIARWDGLNWYALGKGLDEHLPSDLISSLAFYKGELYAAGTFRRMNSNTGYNNIARWDGTTWRKVAGGVIRSGVGVEINSMVVYKGELYVAGYFDQAGSTTAYNIARWDGLTWKALGKGGAWGGIYDLVVDSVRNILYVGGDFNGIDSTIVSRKVAMWDGVQWHGLPTPPLGSAVSALEMYHGYLYAGSMGPNHFARWDGQKWDSIPGVNETIVALQTYNDELYIGGGFTKIGNDTIPYLARYYSPDSVVLGISEKKKVDELIKIYPNPAEDELYISSLLEIKQYSIYDSRGNEIKKDVLLSNKISINEFETGMYFILFSDKEKQFISAQKFIKK